MRTHFAAMFCCVSRVSIVAPVIALTLLATSVSSQTPPERKFVVSAEKPASAYVCNRRTVSPKSSNNSSSRAFYHCVLLCLQ